MPLAEEGLAPALPTPPAGAPATPLVGPSVLDAVQQDCRRLWSDALDRLRREPAHAVSEVRGLSRAGAAFLDDLSIQICLHLGIHGACRYTALRRALPETSTRTLSLRLAQLREAGLLERLLRDEMPVRVDYTLSRRGQDYLDLIFPLLLHLRSTQPAAAERRAGARNGANGHPRA
ncbi:MAG: winged helix-turn-helix transcriptional regulator [Halobacteriales archaeon]|nr:winged helix-turn-helix transcriptional regulator [Halobacteriales archaeon]